MNDLIAFDNNLDNAINAFVGNQLSDATRVAYRYDLKKWFDWYGYLTNVPSINQVVQFRDYLVENFKPRTAARIFNTIRGFYRFVGGLNPFANVKSPKATVNQTPQVPDDAVVGRMMDIIDDPKDRLMVSLMLNGLRRSEIASLRTLNIIFVPEYDRYIIKVVGKGNKERLVPANLDTTLSLQSYRDFGEEFVFPGEDDGHVTPRVVEWTAEKWSKAAGKRYSPHKFRHHYATRLVRAKAPILQVSKLLGHASVATTQIYVTLDLADVVDAANLDPMDRRVING